MIRTQLQHKIFIDNKDTKQKLEIKKYVRTFAKINYLLIVFFQKDRLFFEQKNVRANIRKDFGQVICFLKYKVSGCRLFESFWANAKVIMITE